MKAGRELDALVAEKVMGFSVRREGPPDEWHLDLGPSGINGGHFSDGIPEYSSDIAAAWDVVEKLGERFRRLTLEDGRWYAWVDDEEDCPGTAMERADTAPHAICLAALKTVTA